MENLRKSNVVQSIAGVSIAMAKKLLGLEYQRNSDQIVKFVAFARNKIVLGKLHVPLVMRKIPMAVRLVSAKTLANELNVPILIKFVYLIQLNASKEFVHKSQSALSMYVPTDFRFIMKQHGNQFSVVKIRNATEQTVIVGFSKTTAAIAALAMHRQSILEIVQSRKIPFIRTQTKHVRLIVKGMAIAIIMKNAAFLVHVP